LCDSALSNVINQIGDALSDGLSRVGVICEVTTKNTDIGTLLSIKLAHRSVTIVVDGTLDNPNIGSSSFEWGFLKDGWVGNPDPLMAEYKPTTFDVTVDTSTK
jgi:hypothetical protein